MSGCHVVLCGWLRAQPRHVRKIASWYEGHGHSVTELVTPADGMLPSRMRSHAAAALEELHEHAGTRRPLLFHCFSGHGAILHALLVSQMHHVGAAADAGIEATERCQHRQRHASLGQRHIGTIYDSVPARCDAAQLVRGVGSVLGGSAAASVLLLEPLRAALHLAEWSGARWVLETGAVYRRGFDTLLARDGDHWVSRHTDISLKLAGDPMHSAIANGAFGAANCAFRAISRVQCVCCS